MESRPGPWSFVCVSQEVVLLNIWVYQSFTQPIAQKEQGLGVLKCPVCDGPAPNGGVPPKLPPPPNIPPPPCRWCGGLYPADAAMPSPDQWRGCPFGTGCSCFVPPPAMGYTCVCTTDTVQHKAEVQSKM